MSLLNHTLPGMGRNAVAAAPLLGRAVLLAQVCSEGGERRPSVDYVCEGLHDDDGTERTSEVKTKCAARRTTPTGTVRDMTTPVERLKAARRSAGFAGPKEAAEVHGWSINTYTAHEQGKRGPEVPEKAARTYARAFNVDVEWILYGRGRGPMSPSERQAAEAAESGKGHAVAEIDDRALEMAAAEALAVAREENVLHTISPEDFARLIRQGYHEFFGARRNLRRFE